MAITMDPVLNQRLQDLYNEGFSISHMIDSALWIFFDKPKLSFELEDEQKPKSAKKEKGGN
jgi:hypothetical protein